MVDGNDLFIDGVMNQWIVVKHSGSQIAAVQKNLTRQ
jgi:hypothetical protein